MRIERAYAAMQDAPSHPYLENERHIPPSLLQSSRFAGRIRIDARGNAVFPHFDRQGLCGFEIKNKSFTGFASGGTKGLWLSQEKPDDTRLIFCESAIDALSYAVLFPDDLARYASIGGQLSPQQCELMRSAAAGMPLNAKSSRRRMPMLQAESWPIASGRPSGSRDADDLCFVLHQADGFKDWNDQLRNRPRPSPSSRTRKPSVA